MVVNKLGWLCNDPCVFKYLALWVKFSAGDVLKYFLLFPRKQILLFHANGDNLHEMSNPVFWEK